MDARAVVKQPIVKVLSTKLGADGWLTSGTVAFAVQGASIATASLEFKFVDAPNEAAAIRQAADQLRSTAEAFLEYSASHAA